MSRHVCIVTGSRAEYGLLEPVMRAVAADARLELSIIVCGAHLLPPTNTGREVDAAWGSAVIAHVPMQNPGESRRLDDAAALGWGITGIAHVLSHHTPEWVIVLGDRVEALAGAAAAAIGGIAVAHLHGGDRAEGVADESMRHAITKLAHLHLPATPASAERIIRMGEPPATVHVVGSPAIDPLSAIAPAGDALWNSLGAPDTLLLLHPVGDTDDFEAARMTSVCESLQGRRVLWMAPNHDPGREGIIRVGREKASRAGWTSRDHLPRAEFAAVVKRLANSGGIMVGNSSAGLIECAAMGLPTVDIGERQNGRECPNHALRAPSGAAAEIRSAIAGVLKLDRAKFTHPYGDGRSGERVAKLLATIDPRERSLLRKRCTY